MAFFTLLLMLCSAGTAHPDHERAKKQLQNDNYFVTWGRPAAYKADAVLEIGDGGGHVGTLGWLRFQPEKEHVEVLSIQFAEGRDPYESKWPPDRAPVTVKRARLGSNVYVALLRDLAVVDSAKLTPVQRNASTRSSHNFWVYARLTTCTETLLEMNWAGYENSDSEVLFAKGRAAVRLARESMRPLDFKDHVLTDDERGWASAKFVRDWLTFKELESHWWVRERYIQLIGVVGDKTAFPVLREILAADPPKDKPRGASDGRCVFYAINAVTRLTKKDVRDKPVEQMNIEKMRPKVLDLLLEKE
jgi:hypothetical protein